MSDVVMRSGNPIKIDYTPAAGNVNAGTVVLLGNTTGLSCGITFVDMLNNVLGAVDVGDGTYAAINLNNAANYATVYWENSVKKVTTVSTNNAKFGYIASGGGGGANTTCYVLHDPRV